MAGLPATLDVLIVGAGLSGIDAAVRLAERHPQRSIALIERRADLGGTWDLFRYPGIRSDSDVATLGFPFRPWRGDEAITAGADIQAYIAETAAEFGVADRIHYRHTLVSADWSFEAARWTATLDTPEGPRAVACRFLYLCTGYYRYDAAHVPDYPGIDDFRGTLVVPQFWPADLDWHGQRIVVIGSGATAVTLVPTLAKKAHVTMLQRSPSYVVALPSRDAIARRLQRLLPERAAQSLTRWKNIAMGMLLYRLARGAPNRMRDFFIGNAARALPEGVDVDRHFRPSYDPWDQRVCVVPDGDLFEALREGRARIVTDRIDRFDATGIALASGARLDADIVVSATGLAVELMGGAALSVEGQAADPAGRLSYKGAMLDGLPNLAMAFGYTNASWTLKCDLIARYVARLLAHLDRTGADWAMPVAAPGAERERFVSLTSGYVRRAAHLIPAQGAKAPWRVHQNYLRDIGTFRLAAIDDGAMTFGRATGREAA